MAGESEGRRTFLGTVLGTVRMWRCLPEEVDEPCEFYKSCGFTGAPRSMTQYYLGYRSYCGARVIEIRSLESTFGVC